MISTSERSIPHVTHYQPRKHTLRGRTLRVLEAWLDRYTGPVCSRHTYPLRILVDFTRVSPGGLNGGIKCFAIEILRKLKSLKPAAVTLLWLVQENLIDEALVFADDSDEIWVLAPEKLEKTGDPRVRFTAETGSALPMTADADVLYAPVGVTDLHGAAIPTIGIAVDVLHRDFPDTLPPVEVSVREVWFEKMTRDYQYIQCISEWTAERVRLHYPKCRSKLCVTHCATQAPSSPNRNRNEAERHGFLFPANSWVHKNHLTLLVGYRQYLQNHRGAPWRLVLTGFHDMAMDQILDHAEALGVREYVEFNGYLSSDVLAEVWARTGALIFASLHEGFGRPILEAMHLGVPVVADRIGSVPEVAGDACLYTNMRRPTEIAAALERIQTDSSLRGRLVAEGFRRASKFSLEREAGKLLNVFSQCVAETRRRLQSERTVVI